MTENNNDISVVVTHFNKGILLDDAIQSILRQDYQNFNAVVVDDCSTDALSVATFENWQKRLAGDERFTFIRNDYPERS